MHNGKWFLVLADDGRVIATAAATPPGELDGYASPDAACFIQSVWVHADFRRRGIGTRLLGHLIRELSLVGIRDFYLWVKEGNIAAATMYEQMGFRVTGQPSGLGIAETQYLLTVAVTVSPSASESPAPRP